MGLGFNFKNKQPDIGCIDMSGNQKCLPTSIMKNDDMLLIDESQTHTNNIIIILIPQRAHLDSYTAFYTILLIRLG